MRRAQTDSFKRLKKYLKDMGLYEEWELLVESKNEPGFLKHIKYDAIGTPIDLLYGSFCWGETIDGHEFWSAVSWDMAEKGI